MNDIYLYRAKRIDNGEWVEGMPLFYQDDSITIYGQKQAQTVGFHIQNNGYCDRNTLCQCTGLKDKNDKLIWENDICRRALLPTKRIKTNFKIAYVPYKCCLSAIDSDGSNVTFLSDYINNQYEVEVIGNIFDNPELLEVEE